MWSWAEKKVQVVTSESKREKIQFGSSDTYLTIIQRQPLDDDDDANYNDDYNDNTKGGDDDDGFSDILLLETPCPFVGSSRFLPPSNAHAHQSNM